MARNLRWFVAHFEEALCALFFAVMAVVAFVNVISRYFLKYSLAFTEELLISLFVWLTLLGAAVAFRQGSHLGFGFITGYLPIGVRKVLLWFSALLGASLFSFLIYFSVYQIKEEIVLKITSSGIGIPQWWYTLGMPVWSVLVVLRILQGARQADQKMGESE